MTTPAATPQPEAAPLSAEEIPSRLFAVHPLTDDGVNKFGMDILATITTLTQRAEAAEREAEAWRSTAANAKANEINADRCAVAAEARVIELEDVLKSCWVRENYAESLWPVSYSCRYCDAPAVDSPDDEVKHTSICILPTKGADQNE